MREKLALFTAVALSALFGFTWPSGWCAGDQLLFWLGLTPWSNGDSGLHYTALISLALILLSLLAFQARRRVRPDRG